MVDVGSHAEREAFGPVEQVMDIFDAAHADAGFVPALALLDEHVNLFAVNLLLALDHEGDHVLVVLFEALVKHGVLLCFDRV